MKKNSLLKIIYDLEVIHGITKFQKFIYFLTYYNIPNLKFTFTQHDFGPFSFELEDYIKELEENGLIKIKKDYYNNDTIIGKKSKIEDFLKKNNFHEDNSQNNLTDLAQYKVISLFENLKTTRRIELASSLHYIVWKKEVIFKKEVFQKLNIWKPRKFKKDEMEDIWNFLINEKLFSKDIITANKLIDGLEKIKPGIDDWYDFQKYITNLFKNLFSDDLGDIKMEKKINEGRKYIDIIAFNKSNSSFFLDLINKYNIYCPYIVFECKNYSKDLGNPEIDQIYGRLAKHISKLGILICRMISNRKKVHKNIKDIKQQSRRFIIILEDEDLIEMIRLRFTGKDPSKILRMKLENLLLNN